jgi:hypothetical protein
MPFVVKAVSTSGAVMWLGPKGSGGHRTVSNRALAEVFPMAEDAQAVIDKMPQDFAASGVKFSVVEGDRED